MTSFNACYYNSQNSLRSFCQIYLWKWCLELHLPHCFTTLLHIVLIDIRLFFLENYLIFFGGHFQVILNCNALPNLLHLLGNVRETVRKETCWTISNITAGNKQQIQVYRCSLVLFWQLLINVFGIHIAPLIIETYFPSAEPFLC